MFNRLKVLDDQVYELYAPQRAEDAQQAEDARADLEWRRAYQERRERYERENICWGNDDDD